jgi:GTPase SAR1 family protein
LAGIIKAFTEGTPRIVILGAGGMGKTTLARAVLHHGEIIARYEHHSFFIACDTASTSDELAAIIEPHLGLKPARHPTKSVITHFSNSPASLLILDNLDTVWEPTESRKEVEEFLSLLADISHLALIVSDQFVFVPTTNNSSDYNERSGKTR